MRTAFIAILSLGLAAPVAAARSRSTIAADVEMSEWTAPSRLLLDFESGRYSIVPPSTPWPPHMPTARTRSGTLAGRKLSDVRKAFDAAVADGLSNDRCLAVNGVGYDMIVSNAGVAQMTLVVGGKQLNTSTRYGCWTKAAWALREVLERVFARQTP